MKASLRDSYDLLDTFRIIVDEAQTEFDALEASWIDFECVGRVDASDEPLIPLGRKVSIRFAPDYQGTLNLGVEAYNPRDDYTYVYAPLNPAAIAQVLELLKYSKETGAELYAEIDVNPPEGHDPHKRAWSLKGVKFGLRNLVGDRER